MNSIKKTKEHSKKTFFLLFVSFFLALGGLAALYAGGTNEKTAPAKPQNTQAQLYQVTPDEEIWLSAKPLGYASLEHGTSGGLGASASRTFLVENRAQLLAAFTSASAGDKTIIFVKGTIDLSTNDQGRPLNEADFAVAPYTIEKYLSTYDPKVWNNGAGTGLNKDAKDPSGPLEEARKASAKRQAAHIVLTVPSNTSIIGLGNTALIKHGQLSLKNVNNVVIRNITFQDSYDFFPAWDPGDGSSGNWNSEYDLIALQGTKNVWIDHCSFSDGDRQDNLNPLYFGREYQHHDGLVDITHGSDLVTLSYNIFANHDKTSLIGSSDSATGDRGKLRVTIHNNLYDGAKQRSPRVRFGEVHVFNNYYKSATYGSGSGYGIGLGAESSVYVEANYFEKGVAAIAWYDKPSAKASVLLVNNLPADLKLSRPGQDTVLWKPSDRYAYTALDAESAKTVAQEKAGAGKQP